MEKKLELIRCHADQNEQEEIIVSLNRFRAAQMIRYPQIRFAEAYLKVDVRAQS